MLSFTEIEAGGNFVTVKYEQPRLTEVGSLPALTSTREDGPPGADVGRFPVLPDNPTSATS
jgi:hypothetical protein